MAALLEPAGSVGAAGTRTFAAEDLHKFMHKMNLAETPFMSLVGTDEQIGKVQFDWNVDKFDNPRGAVGHADGVDFTAASTENAGANRRRMNNLGQVFERLPGVGFIAGNIGNVPGVTDEMVDAVQKKLMELRTDIEAGMCSLDQMATDDDGTNGSLTAGLGALTERTNSNTGLSAVAGQIPSTYLPPSASNLGGTVLTVSTGAIAAGSTLNATNFNEASLKAALKALRAVTKRSRTYHCIVGQDIRDAVAAMVDPAVQESAATIGITATKVMMKMRQEDSREINSVVDVYRGTNGELHFITTNLIGKTLRDSGAAVTATRANRVFTEDTKAGYIICKELWKVRYGSLVKVEELAKNGGGDRKVLRTYAGLHCHNPSASGRIWYS